MHCTCTLCYKNLFLVSNEIRYGYSIYFSCNSPIIEFDEYFIACGILMRDSFISIISHELNYINLSHKEKYLLN